MSGPVDWRGSTPVSNLYDDIYFSAEDGLAETEAVFLRGCGLPDAWQGRERFVVAELGFGTGLNIAALLDLWARERPPGAHLHIFSLEAHLMAREDAEKALAGWPRIGEAARALLARWPVGRTGFQRIAFPDWNATLDLAVMEAAEALDAWIGKADAWFLDGFSPARNPQMWRGEVLDLVAAKSAPGARLASFTVAGAVRRGLAELGFEVRKVPGHGRKRERLEAAFGGGPATGAKAGAVAVIGAGIAGASLARAFAAMGREVTVIADPDATAASANPAALVTPALDAGGGARAALYAQAFAHAVAQYAQIPGAVIAKGSLQIEASERDAARFDTVAAQTCFEPGEVRRLDAAEVSAMTGEASQSGLWFENALVVEPAKVLLSGAGAVRPGHVTGLSRVGQAWRITFDDGETLDAAAVVLAAGWGNAVLLPALGLSPVRGQLSTAAMPAPVAMAFGGYVIPTREGLLFGATHDRGDEGLEPREADQQSNLQSLAEGMPALAARLFGQPLGARAAIRATTPDRLPLAGEIAPSLFVLGGLGSRGYCLAPLLADHLAALICGAPSPLPAALARLVQPNRFGKAGA